ncbi:MAG TPA: serine/threonine-protein kinase [Candidatus Obscuribacterales bacterium]
MRAAPSHSGETPSGFFRIRVPSHARDLLVGQVLHGIGGNFYVLSVIGMGGMSVVYKAKHLESGRIFAVKTLRMQALSDELTVKRFMREAHTLTYLHHPNIVRIYDYGNSRRGQPFFVMEFLTGRSLANVIKTEGVLSPERAQRIFYKVLDAMEHAHAQGLIHRDLKPGNIMLIRRRDKSDAIKVVDFGIARFEQEAQRLTRMGEVWGSPIYMSPEQCMGAEIDARTDIYSLGIVMYEALTGMVPFWGKNYVETMSKQISDEPKPFASSLNIPDKVEEIVMRALRKDPEKRFQTVAEMKRELADSLGEAYSYQPAKSGTFKASHALMDSSAHLPAAKRVGEAADVADAPPARSIARSKQYVPEGKSLRAMTVEVEPEDRSALKTAILKVALLGLFVGLALAIATFGFKWFTTVKQSHQRQDTPPSTGLSDELKLDAPLPKTLKPEPREGGKP